MRDDPRRWYASRFFQLTWLVLIAVYLYLGARVLGPSGLGPAGQALGWAGVIALLALVPVSFWVRWGHRRPTWGTAFSRYHFLWLGLLLIGLCLFVVRDAILLIAWLAGQVRDPAALTNGSNLAIALVVAAAAAHGTWWALRTPPVKRVTVPVAGLPSGLAGLRLVQLTDLHIGPTLRRRWVERVVARVEGLRPELVAITGDLVDGSVAQLRDDVAPLGRLRAPLGVWFVPGNHDYYSGLEPWLDELRALGIDVLLNAHRVVERQGARLVVAGVTDPHGRFFGEDHVPDPDRAQAGAPEGAPRLLLAHQPRLLADAAGLGVALQLSGHTHGGQMWPWNFLVKLSQPVVAGLERTADGWIYVSRGTGFWGPPLRLGVPSEITLIELVPAGE